MKKLVTCVSMALVAAVAAADVHRFNGERTCGEALQVPEAKQVTFAAWVKIEGPGKGSMPYPRIIQAPAFYLHPTIPDMAGAYLFHLVENHPFVDGNKRVGAMAALVFLELNEYDFDATDDELTEAVLQVAGGKMPKDALSAFFRQHSRCR